MYSKRQFPVVIVVSLSSPLTPLRYVLGHDAMKKMAGSNVLISGMKGLGVEIGQSRVSLSVLSFCPLTLSLTTVEPLRGVLGEG